MGEGRAELVCEVMYSINRLEGTLSLGITFPYSLIQSVYRSYQNHADGQKLGRQSQAVPSSSLGFPSLGFRAVPASPSNHWFYVLGYGRALQSQGPSSSG